MNLRNSLALLLLSLSFPAHASVLCTSKDSFESSWFQFVQTGDSGVLQFAYAVPGTDTILEGRVTLALLWTSGGIQFFEGSNALDQHAELQILFYPVGSEPPIGALAKLEIQIPLGEKTLSHSAELPCVMSNN